MRQSPTYLRNVGEMLGCKLCWSPTDVLGEQAEVDVYGPQRCVAEVGELGGIRIYKDGQDSILYRFVVLRVARCLADLLIFFQHRI